MPTAFLDRDGTINVKAADDNYITVPEELRLLPRAGEAIRRLNESGLTVVIVTNQRAVARGLMTLEQLAAVTDRMLALLSAEGARVDAIYACTHDLRTCGCRKPAPGLLLRAHAELQVVDLGSSVMIGDTESDVLAGKAAGARTVRLGASDTCTDADVLCRDLADACELVTSSPFWPSPGPMSVFPRVNSSLLQ